MKIGDLIKAWQKQPSEALRALILALDDREPLQDLRELEALKTAQVAERLNGFRSKAKDPRVSRAIEQLVLNVKWSSDGSKPMWRAVFELASKTNDPRLRALAPEFKVRPTMQDWLKNQWASAVEELPEAFEPAKDEAKWARALAELPQPKKPAGARDEAALYANVYADPANDAPRLVLADFLTERGDPRGEFITLQCSGAGDPKKEKALLKANEKKWISPLAPVLARDVEWKRGFPVKGRALFKAQRDAEKYGALPEWATFEELEWSEPGASSANQRRWTLHVGPAFKHLRHANNPWFEGLLEGDTVFPNLETLRVSLSNATDVPRFASSAAKRFPKLHTLRLRWAPSPGWFEGLTGLGNVKTVEIGSTRDLPQWIAVFEKLPIDTLIFDETFSFKRNAAGQFTVLTVTNTDDRHVLGLPNALPPGVAESISFAGAPFPDVVQQKLLEKAGQVVRTQTAPDALPSLSGTTHLAWLDARHVAIPSQGRVLIVDALAEKPRVLRSFACERSLAISSFDGGKAVLLATNTRVIGFDAQSGATTFTLEHDYTGGSHLQFSDDRWRVSRGKTGVFDLKNGKVIDAPKGASEDTRTADDRFWIRWNSADQVYHARWPGQRQGVVLEGATGFRGWIVLGDRFVARDNTGLVTWDAKTGAKLATIACGEGRYAAGVVSACSGAFAFCDDADASALVVSLPKVEEVARVKFPARPHALDLSPDGKHFAVLISGALHVVKVT